MSVLYNDVQMDQLTAMEYKSFEIDACSHYQDMRLNITI